MTVPCGRTGTVTVACGRIADGSCWICRTPPKPGSGDRPPRVAAAPTTARVPDRHVGVASGDPGPALQDAAGNFWPLQFDERGGDRLWDSAPGGTSPLTRRPRSARTVRVPGRGPGPTRWAEISEWSAATDGARVPDKPDQDKPKHRTGCPWDLLVFVAAVLLVFAVVVFCGWIVLRGSGVLR